MSAEERGIGSDDAARDGVILVEEFEQVETRMERYSPNVHQRTYHRRAKVLSEEGVRLAEVELPDVPGFSKFAKWWGRTILPDGTVLELSKTELNDLIAESENEQIVLPGVTPGCVIDYGYALDWMGFTARHARLPIQREWPIRDFYLRWVRIVDTDWRLVSAEAMQLETVSRKGVLFLTGSDLPAVAGNDGATLEFGSPPPDLEVKVDLIESLLEKLIRTETAEDENFDLDSLPAEEREEIIEALKELASQFFVTRPMKRLRGDRFTILSDLVNNEYIQQIAGNLDATFEVMDGMFGNEGSENVASIPVYVYRESISFAVLTHTLGAPGAAGMYLPAVPMLAFGMNSRSGELLASIMIHEASHAYLDQHVRRSASHFPLWFEEGVAEYVGNSDIRGGKLLLGTIPVKQRIRFGHYASTNVKSQPTAQLDFLKKSLRKKERPTLDEMLSADREAFYGEDRAMYYSGSWMFVHFLRHNREGEFQGRFLELVEVLAEEKESHEAVQEVYGDLAELETAYRRYVRRAGY